MGERPAAAQRSGRRLGNTTKAGARRSWGGGPGAACRRRGLAARGHGQFTPPSARSNSPTSLFLLFPTAVPPRPSETLPPSPPCSLLPFRALESPLPPLLGHPAPTSPHPFLHPSLSRAQAHAVLNRTRTLCSIARACCAGTRSCGRVAARVRPESPSRRVAHHDFSRVAESRVAAPPPRLGQPGPTLRAAASQPAAPTVSVEVVSVDHLCPSHGSGLRSSYPSQDFRADDSDITCD